MKEALNKKLFELIQYALDLGFKALRQKRMGDSKNRQSYVPKKE